MNDYLILICRSITHAQRMAAVLRRAGISQWIFRIPAGLLESGCGYAVKIRARDLLRAQQAMRRWNMPKVRIMQKVDGEYHEVFYDLP